MRRPFKPGKSGVLFTSTKSAQVDQSDQKALIKAPAPEEQQLEDITGRFIGSTGQKVDVDQHMCVSPISLHSRLSGLYHSLTLQGWHT